MKPPCTLLDITTNTPFWQTWWFIMLLVLLTFFFIAELFVWRLNEARKKDREQFEIQKKMMDLHDTALRAQMNPHFIFNCLNSIKSLVQSNENNVAIDYLTTFTKLIRSLMQNADLKYVSLDTEIETCRLYTELEALRFKDRFTFTIDIQPDLDLKSVEIPVLIIQPIVENAIWHGLIPKHGKGELLLKVERNGDYIVCTVDDNGIGRAASQLINSNRANHQSKGVSLTSKRIDLFRSLKEHDAQIEIIDKTDEAGSPAGTKIELSFSIN
jgi:LytS/YehU family sensor histidine kinase